MFLAAVLLSILGINSIVSICDCGHRPLDPERARPLESNPQIAVESKKNTQIKKINI